MIAAGCIVRFNTSAGASTLGVVRNVEASTVEVETFTGARFTAGRYAVDELSADHVEALGLDSTGRHLPPTVDVRRVFDAFGHLVDLWQSGEALSPSADDLARAAAAVLDLDPTSQLVGELADLIWQLDELGTEPDEVAARVVAMVGR